MSLFNLKKAFALVMAFVMMGFLVPSITVNAEYPEIPYGYELDDEVYIDFYDLNIVDVFESFDSYLDTLFLEDDYLFEIFQDAMHRMYVQASAVEAYGVLMENFLMEVDGNLDLVYPDNYAGAFVDYDILVIQLTDISDESTAFYWDLLGADAPIRFKEVNFSLNQLIAFGEVFVDAIDAPIVSFGFDTMNNVYNIVLDHSSPDSVQMIESLNETLRFLPIPISLELGMPAEQQNRLPGGTAVIQNRSSRPITVGITGTALRSQTDALLLTTGHGFRGYPAGTAIRRGNDLIGSLRTFREGPYSVGSPGTTHGDWAIISLINTSFITNQMRCGRRLTGFWSAGGPPVGSVVNGTGGMTFFWTSTISAVNQSKRVGTNIIGLGGYDITGLTRTIINGNAPVSGDSGAPMWQNNSGDTNSLVGIHAGRRERPIGIGNVYGYFSPFSWSRPHIEPWISSNLP